MGVKSEMFEFLSDIDTELSKNFKENLTNDDFYSKLSDGKFDSDFAKFIKLDDILKKFDLLWISTSFRCNDKAVPLAVRGKDFNKFQKHYEWILTSEFFKYFDEPMNILL